MYGTTARSSSLPFRPGVKAGITVFVALLAACSGAPEDGEAREAVNDQRVGAQPEVPPVPSPPEQLPRMPLFDPPAGPVGSDVELWMDGLPRSTELYIGFGTVQEHTIVQEVETDEEGILATTISIPGTARENRSHYFFVADANQLPLSVSAPFHVTDPEGRLEIRGEVEDAEGPCITVRGPEDELYSLQGAIPPLAAGDRVTVRGRAVLEGGCERGLTIQVERVEEGR
jgi:hypothetical protein